MTNTNFDHLIFTHIPKCAGTSFREYLNRAAMNSGLSNENVYIPGFNNVPNNKNIRTLSDPELDNLRKREIKVWAGHQKHNMISQLGLTNYKNPFCFTILRNPIDRFVSHYNYFNYHLGYNDCKGVHLNDLDHEKLNFILKRLGDLQVMYLSNVKMIKAIGLDNILKVAKYNLLYEHHAFGILERMDESIKVFRLKKPKWLTFNMEFPRKNANTMKHDLGSRVLKLIEENNSLDIELYRFAVEQFGNQLRLSE